MRSRILVVLLTLSSLAGCAGNNSSDAASSDSGAPQAAEPTISDTGGSVTGIISNEELAPIVGAAVILRGDASSTAETDATGRFTFNELSEGVYELFAQRLGYESRGIKVVVAPGVITHANLTLKAIQIAKEPYYALNNMVGFIELGQSYFDYYLSWDAVNQCSKCEFYVHLAPTPHDVRFEAWWTKSVSLDPISHNIYFLVRKNWNNATLASQQASTSAVVSGYFNYGEMPRPMAPSSPQSNTTATERLKGVNEVQVRIGGGFSSIAFQQKVDMWMSFAYDGSFPDDFSAYPKA